MENQASETGLSTPAEKSFLTLKRFFETRASVAKALALLELGVEIGVVIGDSVECALSVHEGQPRLERRSAKSPDVVFSIRPETVELLNDRTADDLSDIGIQILKEMIAGNVSVRLEPQTNVLDLLRRGYLRVVAAGGPAVSAFLARHGLTGVTSFINTFKKMRP